MCPSLSETRNRLFPYLLKGGSGAELLRKDAAGIYIQALARVNGVNPREIRRFLASGGVINFTWQEDEMSGGET